MPGSSHTRHARVIVIAGPSGAGKSRLTRRLGLPAINLDDFYKDGEDPTLPTVAIAGGDAIIDWDSPASWNSAAALEALEQICREGAVELPRYDISASRTTGRQRLSLDGAHFVIAEGIFAQEIVEPCRARGILADAVCVTQHPAITFVRRLSRDLREHRKPPFYLVRRGLHLALGQRRVVEHAAQRGCRVRHPHAAYEELVRLTRA